MMHAQFLLKTEVRATPQVVLAAQMVQATAVDLEAIVQHELANNPALEWQDGADAERSDRNYGDGASRGSSSAADDILSRIPAALGPREQLATEVALLANGIELDVAVNLIYLLDEHGYLRQSTTELLKELKVSEEQVEHGVHLLHQLEPSGVGARNLQECLLLQLEHLAPAVGGAGALARRIVAETWDELSSGQRKAIASRLNVSTTEVDEAAAFIRQRLDPYPLRLLKDSSEQDAVFHQPDLVIHRHQGSQGISYRVEIPAAERYGLHVSPSFTTGLEGVLGPQEQAWVASYTERARLFITALRQRWQTLLLIGNHLVTAQQAYLERGPRYLQPMTRRAVAAAIDLHESTVGRAVHNKVVQLPNGRMAYLSEFFDASLPVRAAISQLLIRTDDRLTDQQIADELRREGLLVSRRTVTKYRQKMRLPSSHAQIWPRGIWKIEKNLIS